MKFFGKKKDSVKEKVKKSSPDAVKRSLENLKKNILEMSYIADGTNVAINAVGNSIEVISDANSDLASRTREINKSTVKMGQVIDQTSQYVEDLHVSASHMSDSNQELSDIFRKLMDENSNTQSYIEEIAQNTLETNQATGEIRQGVARFTERDDRGRKGGRSRPRFCGGGRRNTCFGGTEQGKREGNRRNYQFVRGEIQ